MQPSTNDSAPLPQFAQIALGLRYVTRAQIDECFQIQVKQREMGLSPSLAMVFVQKRYLTVHQLGEVMRRVSGGRELVAVPGYEILEKLGEGGMGAVYRARHVKLGRTTALKLLRKDEDTTVEATRRFIREARAAAVIEHPSVVRVYDIGETGAHLYIAMELVEGGSARAVLESEGSLSERLALSICADAAAALAAAARHAIVHRDVKPANILVQADGSAKLCDLGIAKRLTGKDQSITRRGVLLGTPHYMAPEQASGEPVDARTDLYALGATLHHLIAGAPPFDAATPMDLLFMHVTLPPPSLRALRPDVSGRTAALAAALMAKSPSARPRDAVTVEREMREIVATLPPEASRRRFIFTPPPAPLAKRDEAPQGETLDDADALPAPAAKAAEPKAPESTIRMPGARPKPPETTSRMPARGKQEGV